ncbi:ribosomal protein S5 domain 2-type protein [Mycena maculata]|uniref:Phosphomevalonate kinase n=1 Tax=Mycena maculata TaxID=230809 RepID=A0AAD7JTP9_9AGAR|nr:ribosomal protein S5 domain 2-type protein [Mycena maculata]
MDATVVSSPGKVLVAGGYLVLDRTYAGVVVSTSSRFYTVIQSSSSGDGLITVRSPQFLSSTWRYSVELEPSVLVEELPTNATNNKFVHLALQNILALACEMKGAAHVGSKLSSGIDISIVGDNDFYSQRAQLASLGLPRTLASLGQITPFVPTGVNLSAVHKTGLGSSAALITSLVSSLLLHLSVVRPSDLEENDSEGRRLAHNLSQFVHCLAQGKVGSGFDVSAAVFGSHIYTRFDPAVLQELMSDDASRSQPLLPIISPSNEAWNYHIGDFQLPPFTRMMLADVDAGSDTPSLVGKVLQWRKEDSVTADGLWSSLGLLNDSLAKTLLKLKEQHSKDPATYEKCLNFLAVTRAAEWLTEPRSSPEETIVSTFNKVRQISEAIRSKMREMGTLSGVPIEPIEQTNLLDLCVSQPGVIGGGVPGAGGYDALWLLVCDPIDTLDPNQRPVEVIESVWSTYKELDVSPLSAVESMAKGARIEQLDKIPGLRNAVAH